jgi:membrane protein YqaA with SNARE-associated domain
VNDSDSAVEEVVSVQEGTAPTKTSKSKQRLISVAIILMVVGIVAVLAVFRDSFRVSGAVGYPTIALLNLIASASVFVPVPGVAAVCTGGVMLSPLLTALVATVPASVGELSGYAAGRGGAGLVTKGRYYHTITRWMKKRGWLVLFVLSAVPNPVFDVAGVAAGALRYPVWRFLAILCAGKLVKFLIIAYGCHYGAEGVMRFFRIG